MFINLPYTSFTQGDSYCSRTYRKGGFGYFNTGLCLEVCEQNFLLWYQRKHWPLPTKASFHLVYLRVFLEASNIAKRSTNIVWSTFNFYLSVCSKIVTEVAS